MKYQPGQIVYAVGPGLSEFVRYTGRKTADVKSQNDGITYSVPVEALSPTTQVTEESA